MSDAFLREMLFATKLSILDLNRVIITAPKRYKVYRIPKRSGGHRVIAHPSRELKVLQYLVLERMLKSLPVHRCAAAYVERIGILDNATAHLGKRYILKLDFESFFPSLKVSDWRKYIARKECKLKLDNIDNAALERILFWGDGERDPVCLSIGAPTSPIISNILMFKFDVKVYGALQRLGVTYTRYADDITLSCNDLLAIETAERQIKKIVKMQKWPLLKLNDAKRGLFTKGVRQMVTGLIVTPEGKVSIGRERKRLIRAMTYSFAAGKLAIEDTKKLQGLLGFAIGCEPDFVEALRAKYGSKTIKIIQRYR